MLQLPTSNETSTALCELYMNAAEVSHQCIAAMNFESAAVQCSIAIEILSHCPSVCYMLIL